MNKENLEIKHVDNLVSKSNCHFLQEKGSIFTLWISLFRSTQWGNPVWKILIFFCARGRKICGGRFEETGLKLIWNLSDRCGKDIRHLIAVQVTCPLQNLIS